MHGALPNLIVIGAQKCGTTSLHSYLGRHPQIGMSRRKELHYFRQRGDRSLDWYRSWFDPRDTVRGETSPGYTNAPFDPGVPARMYAAVPDARLIYLVRDPLSRALAAWRHKVAEGQEHRSVNEALADPEGEYVVRSCYALQLGEYLPFYPTDRILLVEQEALLTERAATMTSIFDWLGVDPSYRSIWFKRRQHRTKRKRRRSPLGLWLSATRPMRAVAQLPDPARWMLEEVIYRPFSRAVPAPELDPALREQLQARFKRDTAELRRQTGRSLDRWTV